jgi:hypothetical protein
VAAVDVTEARDVVDTDAVVVEELETLALEVATAPWANSSTRLFSPSLTQRFPEESNAIPSSPYISD